MLTVSKIMENLEDILEICFSKTEKLEIEKKFKKLEQED